MLEPYKIVTDEYLKAKDCEIERLKAELRKAAFAKIDDLVAEQLRKDQESRDHGLRIALNAAKAENQHLKRLMNDRGTYDTSMIESFDERTPEELAKFVEFELSNGGKTSFAAACLVLMWHKYEQQAAANKITRERIADAADAVNRLYDEIAAD